MTGDQLMAEKNNNKSKIVLFPGMAGMTRDMVKKFKKDGAELLSVDIMVTQKCNFKCIYCYAEAGPDRSNQLTMSEAKRVVDESLLLGVKIINMQGGEPLIWHPDDWSGKTGEAFFHLIEYAKDLFEKNKLPLSIVSFTDVAVITLPKAKRLAGLGVSLCCKLDSLDMEIQDKLLSVKGGFNRIMDGFKNLIEAGYGKPDMPPLSTNTVVTSLNYDGVADVFRWSRQRNFRPFVVPVHVHGTAKKYSSVMLSEKPAKGMLNSEDMKRLFEKLAEIDGKEFGIRWKAESPWVENKACSRHLGGVHVKADGMVMPCSEAPDFWALGDIKTQSLVDIIKSDKVRKFRRIYSQLHRGTKCSPDNCQLSKEGRCYGCRTRAYDDSGFDKKGIFNFSLLDPQAFFAGDPACWRKCK